MNIELAHFAGEILLKNRTFKFRFKALLKKHQRNDSLLPIHHILGIIICPVQDDCSDTIFELSSISVRITNCVGDVQEQIVDILNIPFIRSLIGWDI